MPKNIRVYELARELGMENTEVLDLCGALGIGVKSHSSGMVEAQADRVRRRAEKEGLIREPAPEPEPEPEPRPRSRRRSLVAGPLAFAFTVAITGPRQGPRPRPGQGS